MSQLKEKDITPSLKKAGIKARRRAFKNKLPVVTLENGQYYVQYSEKEREPISLSDLETLYEVNGKAPL